MQNQTIFSRRDKEKGLKIPNVLSSDLAYLCGVFAGDGSINVRQIKNDYYLKCVGNPQDEKLLYKNIIGPKFKNVFGFTPTFKYHDSKTTYGFTVFSKALITYLNTFIGLPIGKKYESLRIPKVFLSDEKYIISFMRGLFDTDGSICFKKRYRSYPYYPVICLSSSSETLARDVAKILKKLDFKIMELYNYKVIDKRIERGFTVISRIELNGRYNLILWNQKIGFFSPKHLKKINKYWKE